MKKRKIGSLLILIGIGIPLILFFFQDEGIVYTIKTQKAIERKLSPKEIITLESELNRKISKKKVYRLEDFLGPKIELIFDIFGKNHFSKEKWTITTYNQLSIPYRQTLGIGILFIFIGIGIFIFSLFPKEPKSKKQDN